MIILYGFGPAFGLPDAMVAGVLAPTFDAPLVRAAHRLNNLVAYAGRMMERYYPAFLEG